MQFRAAWTDTYLNREDEDGYVPFNEDRRLGSNQYVSRYVDGRHGEPNLGEGLRWKFKGDSSNYHFIRIHRDDLEEFHNRVVDYKKSIFGF
jgi:hypothetical protein